MNTGSRSPTVATNSGASRMTQRLLPRAKADSPNASAKAMIVPPASIMPSVAGWYWPAYTFAQGPSG